MKIFAFKNKMFRYYAALVIALVMVFAILLEVFLREMNRDLEVYQQRKLVQGDAVEVASMLESMDALAQQVISSNEFVSYFIPLSSDGDAGDYFERNLLDSIRASSQLATMNSMISTAARISVYNDFGDYISTGRMFETREIIRQTMNDADRRTTLYRAIDENGGVFVSGLHEDEWSDNQNAKMISLYRLLSPAYTNKVYGIVEIQQEAEMLLNIQCFNRNARPETAIFANGGQMVYGNIEGLSPEEVYQSALSHQEEDSVYLFRSPSYTVIAADIGSFGWKLVRFLPNAALDEPYTNIYISLAIGAVVLTILLLIAVYMMADKISSPLHELSESVGRVNLNNMELPAIPQTSSTTKEVQDLDRAFRGMLGRLNQAMDLEMKAYMHALQSQMNPHFLYNMLSAIMETADEEGSTHAVAMCEKLSRMLRYAVDYGGGELVSMQDEIAHARNYLDLMKERYEDRFDYEIITDDQMEDIRVPRIILQPLVENSFQHGFKSVRPPWMIRMEIHMSEDQWRVRVEDNGIGATPDEIQSIHEKINSYRRNFLDHYDSLRMGGMGLVSTVVRLTLQKGEDAFFEVGNREEGGIYVVIGGKI